MSTLRRFLFVLALLLLTLYIPLSITVYSSSWYEYNYERLGVYEEIGEEKAVSPTMNLIGFFLYKERLGNEWDEREKKHMEDVRTVYSIFFILAVLSFFYLVYNYERSLMIWSSLIVLGILVIVPLAFINFESFWIDFHKLLFTNDYWIIYPGEISYYLFPLGFFRNSVVFIVGVGIIGNLCNLLTNWLVHRGKSS